MKRLSISVPIERHGRRDGRTTATHSCSRHSRVGRRGGHLCHLPNLRSPTKAPAPEGTDVNGTQDKQAATPSPDFHTGTFAKALRRYAQEDRARLNARCVVQLADDRLRRTNRGDAHALPSTPIAIAGSPIPCRRRVRIAADRALAPPRTLTQPCQSGSCAPSLRSRSPALARDPPCTMRRPQALPPLR
jgi:hypothetical protein